MEITLLGELIGETAFGAWIAAASVVKSNYEAVELWGKGGKAWEHECKYRCGGKTLCALYGKAGAAGVLIIFGRGERERFEAARPRFSAVTQRCYDEAKTYHDGKWVLFPLDYTVTPAEIEQLLFLKKKPNKKLMRGAKRHSLDDVSRGKCKDTCDMLYSYKRKTETDSGVFRFSFEFDLNKEITDGDLADMVIHCCQRDLRLQEILSKSPPCDTVGGLLAAANEYRKRLLENT